MAGVKDGITLAEATRLYPDEWVVSAEPRIDPASTTFIEGVVRFHGTDRDVALERSSEIDGDAAVHFTGTPHYRTVTHSTDAEGE